MNMSLKFPYNIAKLAETNRFPRCTLKEKKTKRLEKRVKTSAPSMIGSSCPVAFGCNKIHKNFNLYQMICDYLNIKKRKNNNYLREI